MYENWKILKKDLEEKQDEYAKVAAWCNETDKYHIDSDSVYYFVAKNEEPKELTVEEKVKLLEKKYNMNRWQREIILAKGSGASAYTKEKAQKIEDLAKELR